MTFPGRYLLLWGLTFSVFLIPCGQEVRANAGAGPEPGRGAGRTCWWVGAARGCGQLAEVDQAIHHGGRAGWACDGRAVAGRIGIGANLALPGAVTTGHTRQAR